MLLWLAAAPPVQAQQVEPLFPESIQPFNPAKLPDVNSVPRVFLARPNPAVIALLQETKLLRDPLRVAWTLFTLESHTLVLDRRNVLGEERVVCLGGIEGKEGGQVILGLTHGAVAGTVLIPGRGHFQIQSVGNGWCRVVEADANLTARCGVTNRFVPPGPTLAASPVAPEAADFGAASADPPPMNAQVDLLVVYTQAARDGAGGTDGMNALIDVAVAEANAAFENSQAQAQVRLVHRAEIDYVETGNINQDLENLEDDDHDGMTDPGPIHGVHQLRRQYGADLVCMITEATGGPLGLANIMHEVEVDFSEKAFSVVQRQYANTYYVLAHEIGHNFGCQHDIASSPSGGAFGFSHGHVFTVEGLRYRTIMAMQAALPVPHYSNPDVTYLGVPTGVPEDATNAANNAKTINLTAATVAQFSSLLLTGAPPAVVILAPTNGSMVPAGDLRIAVDASDPDGQVLDVSFILDGSRVAQLLDPPFEWQWINATPGLHFFRASARDNTGWRVSTALIAFTVAPPPPVIDSVVLSGGVFVLRASGTLGQQFRIDASADLIEWTPVWTDMFDGGPFAWSDPLATSLPARFYRVVAMP